MKNKLTRYGILIIAAVVLVALTGISAVVADTADNASQIRFATGYDTGGQEISVPAIAVPSKGMEDGYFVSSSLPSAYDARDDGVVTPVKDQGLHGACWAFAFTSAFESNILKKGYETDIDLSEYQLAYFFFNRTGVTSGPVLPNLTGLDGDNVVVVPSNLYFEIGGDETRSTNMVSSGIGMAKESDMGSYLYEPYNPNLGDQIIPPEYSEPVSSYTLKGTYLVNLTTNRDMVKEYLQKYGCGTIGYYTNATLDEYPKNSDNQTTHYETKITSQTHDVTLVGWNDSIKIEKDAYGNNVSKTGAWLVKNSWDTWFGDNGYFWLAYDDVSLTYAVFLDVEPTRATYDTILQYDGSMFTTSYFGTPDSGYLRGGFANNFTVEKNLRITNVSFWANNPNIDYNVTIYKNGVSVGSTTGSLIAPGYHTISLSSPVDALINDTVFVAVFLQAANDTIDIHGHHNLTMSYDYLRIVSYPDKGIHLFSTTAYELGQSYIYDFATNRWEDVNDPDTGDVLRGNARIKAFGTEIPVPVKENFSVTNATGSPVTFPLTVEFTNSTCTVNVTPASGVYGMGAITTTYTNVSSGLEEIPKNVGTYYVNVSTSSGTNFSAITDLNLGLIIISSRAYNITYVTNGGSAIANETYLSGVETKVLNTSSKKTGYHFDGWYANSSFSGTNVTEITTEEFGDKTFYAKWVNNTYTVHFDGNRNTSGYMADQVFTYDVAQTLSVNTYVRTGYNFTNWTTNADGTGLSFADGESVQNLTTEDNSTLTLYAGWIPAPAKEYTNTSGSIKLDAGTIVREIDVSGTNISKISFVYETGLTIPARSGYHDQETFGDAFNITVTGGDFASGKAVINFNVSVSDLAGRSATNVWLAHLKNGVWEFLKTTKTGEDSTNLFFSAETTSFSPFYPVYMVQNTASTPTSSSSSSRHSGGSLLLLPGQTAPGVETSTPEPTPEPTVVSTPVPTAVAPSVPAVSSTTQPTQSSPAPFVGIIAGLGVAALVLARMRP